MSSVKKLILVIGATGAQGTAVINALLAPAADGSPSPYAIRALTRDPSHERAQALTSKGVECVKGAFDDLATVREAFKGVYGAWVNTDGFTVPEIKEVYLGMRIFEEAKAAGTVRHYVYSSLDYASKKGKYQDIYKCEHYDGKGRVADWMKAQPSVVSEDELSWSVVTTGPYMDMLRMFTFGPLNVRADGTAVFVTPVGQGHVPMIALADLGFWARYTFDHRSETSAKELEIASDVVSWKYLAETFTKVTGKPAIVINQSVDEWFDNFENADIVPLAKELNLGEGTSWKANFSRWWALYRDDVLTRDLDWIRSINPNSYTIEKWMRENEYTGQVDFALLKNLEGGALIPKLDMWAKY